MKKTDSFQYQLHKELDSFLTFQQHRFPADEVVKIDLHCHDKNSDVPDELLGRILNVPETWLETTELVETLIHNGADVITITNHNNARSCFEMQNKGHDVLVGAEFSVTVPDFQVGIHVLTYGFSEEQEKVLKKLRRNVYQFLQYTYKHRIPTVWAHPLYNYSKESSFSFEFFRKMALIFDRFEVINGQRDTWQNMLVKTWIEQMTPQQINADAEEFGIDLFLYSDNPYQKSFTGGSDSHMGIFAGQTGTLVHIPDLAEKRKTQALSELVLESIRVGRIAPYGTHQTTEKLTIAFLDYVCQIAMYKKDPGLMRILLHKGTAAEKLQAVLISNAFSELSNHKVTMKFIELFHNCFKGKVPSFMKRLLLPKVYKPVFDLAQEIARAHELPANQKATAIHSAINTISDTLNEILFSRLEKKIEKLETSNVFENGDINEMLSRLDVPSDLRTLFTASGNGNVSNLTQFVDGLSFPFLASSLILGANFTSAKVLYSNRKMLNEFADKLNCFHHPKRMLWLTDTFDDKNGVSSVLQAFHKEIVNRELAIDILVCSSSVIVEAHLYVQHPLLEMNVPFYNNQPLRIPNINELHHFFIENEYDRVMCSTEGPMGGVALYLKHAFSVPAYFYMHTDWLMFGRKVLGFNSATVSRARRMLRAYYQGFDKVFVLNSDHRKWLESNDMGIAPDRICQTAHWVDAKYKPQPSKKKELFDVDDDVKVIVYAGRLSAEKGVLDLVDIYSSVEKHIDSVLMVFAGTGPAEEQLRKKLPEALFLGWVDSGELPEIYSSADVLLLPSKFDTFSCVVLEALSCSLPVIAYKAKGPKDIIQHGECGYLASGKNDMIKYIASYLLDSHLAPIFKANALQRAADFQKDDIINQFLIDTGINDLTLSRESCNEKDIAEQIL